MRVQEGKEREQRAKRLFEEIMSENIPNLMIDMNLYIQEAH